MGELGVIHKLTKWVILRNEQKYDKAIENIKEINSGDSALQIRVLTVEHEKTNADILLRSNIVSIVVLGITILSAVLSFFGVFG